MARFKPLTPAEWKAERLKAKRSLMKMGMTAKGAEALLKKF